MANPDSRFALRSRRILAESGEVDGAVLVAGGLIEDIVAADQIEGQQTLIDAGESVVMPGLVDTHVHINEPGRTEWEGFGPATRAAAAGGVTTVIDMPLNSIPATTGVAALEEKMRAAEGRLHVDCGFHGGVVPGNVGELGGLAAAGVFGFKAFMIESGVPEFAAVGEGDLRASMSVIARTDLPLLVHAELPAAATPPQGRPEAYGSWLAARPRRWENDAIGLLVKLSDEYDCPVHIVHLSSSDALILVRRARARGVQLTVETCPHYLRFASEDIADGQTLLKCAPPIRESENRERLWAALDAGVIDLVVSDHSPSPPDMKCLSSGDFFRAWGGIASLQFGLPVVWTEARSRGIPLERVAEWMSAAPARLVGLFGKKGVLRRGADADMIIFDPNATFAVEPRNMLSRHRLTPYEGHILSGVVEKTFLRGALVYDGGSIVGDPIGATLSNVR